MAIPFLSDISGQGATFAGNLTIQKDDPTITLYNNGGANTDPNGTIIFSESNNVQNFDINYNGASDRLEFRGRVGNSDNTDLVLINRDLTTTLQVLGGATFAGRVSAGGASNPTGGAKLHVADGTGAGLEVIPSTTNDTVTLLSYDRNATAYQSLNFEALDFSFLNGNATFAGDVTINRSVDTSSPIITISNDDSKHMKMGVVRSAAGTAPNTSFIAYDGDFRLIPGSGNSTEKFTLNSSGNATFAGDVTVEGGQIYINDTNTKLEEGTGNAFRVTTDSGYIDIGPKNTGHCHIETNRTNFYFNKELRVNTGIISSYDEDLSLQRASSDDGSVNLNIGMLYSTSINDSQLQLGGFTLNTGLEDTYHVYMPGVSPNAFAGAHRRLTVTATKNGASISAASLANAFLAHEETYSVSTANTDTIIIEISGFGLNYGQWYGIAFGSLQWRAKDIDIEVSSDNGSNYTSIYSENDQPHATVRTNYSSGSTLINKIKYTLTNWNTASTRINHIFGYKYLQGDTNYLDKYRDETMYSSLNFRDVYAATFGNSGDLVIKHTGSDSIIETHATASAGDLYIKSQGTNHDLYLQAADDIFIRPQNGENGIKVHGNDNVELYFNNVRKLRTTSTGINVEGEGDFSGAVNMASGKITSDGSAAAGAYLELKHANNNTTDVCATINLTNNTGGYAAIVGGTTGANNSGYIQFKTDNAGTQSTVLTLNHDNKSVFNGNVEITGDTASPHSDNAFLVLRGSDGSNAFRVQNSGEVVVQNNYLYAAGAGTSLYVQAGAVIRGDISNDGGDVRVADNLVVTGNLTVDGTTTTLNTQTVEVEDNILQLNTTQGSPDTATAATSGISIYRGDGVTQASFIFDDGDDTWDLTNNLVVAGDVNITNNKLQITSASPEIILSVPGGGLDSRIYNDGSGNFIIGNGDNSATPTERMRILSDGKVGIGTSDVSHQLQLHNPSGNGSQMNFTDSTTTTTDGSGLRVGYNGTAGQMYLFENSYLRFATNNTERMRIASDGKIGIGKTPSTWSFDVDTGLVYIAAFDGANNTGVIINSNNSTAAQIVGYSNSASTYNDLDIRANSTPGSGVYIDGSTSRVGIGTTTPENKLHILTSTTDTSSQLMVQNGSTGDAAIKFNISGQSYVIGIDNSDSNKFKISGSSALGTTDRLVIDGSGNATFEGNVLAKNRLTVGQNTVNGSYGLYAAGSFGVGGNATFAGDVNAPGLVYNASTKYLSISHWSSPPTPAAMLHLSDNSNSLDVPQIRIEGRENPGDTVLDIAVKDADVRFNLVEGSTDAASGYGRMHFKTNASANSSNPTRGGFLFQSGPNSSLIDVLDITNEGNATFAGDITTNGDIIIDNSSGDPFLKLKTTAQEWVVRIDQSDSEKFQIRNVTGTDTALSIDTSSNATFAGNVTLSSTAPILYLANTTSSTGKTWRFSSAANGNAYITQDGVIDAITLSHTSGNATFAGDVLVPSNNVGIGTMPSGGPQAALHVSGAFNTNAPTGNGVLMGLYNSTHGYIQLNGSSGSYIDFSVSGVDHKGRILYDNASNYMRFDTDGSEKLRIESNGNITLKQKGTIKYEENTDVDSAAAEAVASVVHGTHTAAFFDYVIKKGTNVRAGVVTACHDGTNVEYAETSTIDLGDTSDVTLSVDISGTLMRLIATTTSNDWSVKSLIRAI